MTEDEARAWIASRHGDIAVDRLARFLAMVCAENARQNLIAPSTIPTIWIRHALDSAQLSAFDREGEPWLDIGTGGGFPGIVVALLRAAPVTMIEPRKRRAMFLQDCVDAFDLSHATVIAGRVEQLASPFGVISARAVASLDRLFDSAIQCAGQATRWILPKGRTAAIDLDDARQNWRGVFHVEQSVVEAEAGIIIAERLRRR